jgi:hypothetical protein
VLVLAAVTPIAMAAQGFGAAVGDAAQDLDLSRAERVLCDEIRPFRARDRAEGD